MSGPLNFHSYQWLLRGDLEWLLKQPRTLERDHVECLIRWEIEHPESHALRVLPKREREVSDLAAKDAEIETWKASRVAAHEELERKLYALERENARLRIDCAKMRMAIIDASNKFDDYVVIHMNKGNEEEANLNRKERDKLREVL